MVEQIENRFKTIFMMRQAGIAVWMLTGDKQETAINIGFSCKLIDEHQELFSLDTDSLEVRSRLRIFEIAWEYPHIFISVNTNYSKRISRTMQ